MNAGAVPFQLDPRPGLVGIVFDQEVGFLVNFPIFLLVLPGVLLTASRRWVRLHVHVVAVVVPYTLMICSFPAWSGAWSPPARFMAVVLPMLAGYIGMALQRAPTVLVRAFGCVAVVFAGALTVLAVSTPDGGFSAQQGRNAALASLGELISVDLTRFVPSAAVDGQWVLLVGWTIAAVGIAVLVWALGRNHPARLRRRDHAVSGGRVPQVSRWVAAQRVRVPPRMPDDETADPVATRATPLPEERVAERGGEDRENEAAEILRDSEQRVAEAVEGPSPGSAAQERRRSEDTVEP